MSPANSSPVSRTRGTRELKEPEFFFLLQSLIQYKGRLDDGPSPEVARTHSGVGVMKQMPDPWGMLQREHQCNMLDGGGHRALQSPSQRLW